MTDAWPHDGVYGFTPDDVRAALAAGADANGRLGRRRNTPLHQILLAPAERGEPVAGLEAGSTVEAVELLIRAGADLDAVNETGETPLWCAVRRGRRDHTVALLAAGADPWRTVLGGLSAGRIALDGPLADLFEHLPDAPEPTAEERRFRQEADGLIAGYDSWLRDPQSIMARAEPWARKVMGIWEVFCVAFVEGPDEEEVIRRMGVDASACPTLGLEEYQERCSDAWEVNRDASGRIGSTPEEAWLWVATAATGGVVVFHGDGILPINERFCSRITIGGGLLASVFHYGEVSVNIWRDGNREGCLSPHHDPWPGCPDDAWRCRFGDAAHDSSSLARSLALMSLLTRVHIEPEWFVTVPKLAVRLSEPPI